MFSVKKRFIHVVVGQVAICGTGLIFSIVDHALQKNIFDFWYFYLFANLNLFVLILHRFLKGKLSNKVEP